MAGGDRLPHNKAGIHRHRKCSAKPVTANRAVYSEACACRQRQNSFDFGCPGTTKEFLFTMRGKNIGRDGHEVTGVGFGT
jgi:hypothetical protein